MQPYTSEILAELADELGMIAGALTTVELPATPRLQPWED